MNPVRELLQELVDLRNERSIPYAVMGGCAVRCHGLPRPTYDVDLTIDVDRGQAIDLLQTLADQGFNVAPEYLSGWVDRVGKMPMVTAAKMQTGRAFSVDLFIGDTAFLRSVLERRQRVEIDGVDAWVVSPEDLILLKLVAGRPRDISDIHDVWLVQGQLDRQYMERWAKELEVAEQFSKLLDGFKVE